MTPLTQRALIPVILLLLAGCAGPLAGNPGLRSAARAVTDWPTPSVMESVAQAAADAAALAGASSFLEAHDDEGRARAQATEYVELNDEAHPRIRLQAPEIQVDLAKGIIRVTVEARADRLPATLQRLVGMEEILVKAFAAAEAQDVRCVDTGLSPEGYPTQRCEGVVKYLRLIPWHPSSPPRRHLPSQVRLRPLFAVEEARRNLEPGKQRDRLQDLMAGVTLVPETPRGPDHDAWNLPDKDVPILAAAVRARATRLLTGDLAHFGHLMGQTVDGVLVLRPATYLQS